jgi:hypothetical protein
VLLEKRSYLSTEGLASLAESDLTKIKSQLQTVLITASGPQA